jgi:hypothetical protein
MLIPHYRDVLSELSAAGAEYLLVGAFAMAAHELPRATSGIELGIRPSPENAGRVWNALARFGAPMEKLSVEELADPDLFFQLGVAPVRIDILTRIDGVNFDDAWAERVVSEFEGVAVPVLSRRHLLINKRASDRPKDRADAAWLEEGSRD